VKIYLSTWLSDSTQQLSLDQTKASSRLFSYFFLKDEFDVSNQLNEIVYKDDYKIRKRRRNNIMMNERKINIKSFLQVLSKVMPGVASNEIVEQSTHFIFNDDVIYTNNEQITISVPFETGIVGSIQADLFYKLMQKLTATTVTLLTKQDENELKLVLRSGRTKGELRLQEHIMLSGVEVNKLSGWSKLPEQFFEAVKFCVFSASSDVTRPALTCLNVSGDAIISCDNIRLTRKKLSSVVPQDFLFPASAAKQLVKYSLIDYIVDVKGGWIHFRDDEGAVFSCCTVKEKYPSVEKILQISGESIELPAEYLLEGIKKTEVVSEQLLAVDAFVKLKLMDGKLICRGEGHFGWIEETIQISRKGPVREVLINPEFLVHILTLTNKAVLGDQTIAFVGDGFEHVIMLLHPEDDE